MSAWKGLFLALAAGAAGLAAVAAGTGSRAQGSGNGEASASPPPSLGGGAALQGVAIGIAPQGVRIGGSERVKAQPPHYLAPRDRIDRPIQLSGLYPIQPLPMVPEPAPGEDVTDRLVGQFVARCVRRALEVSTPGPDIDVRLLDPPTPLRPDGSAPVVRGRVFCVPAKGDDYEDAKAMASGIAASPAMLSPDNDYVPREPFWCGGGRGLAPGPKANRPLAVSALGGNRSGQHCWAAAQTADYDRVVWALQQELAARKLRVRPERLVRDGAVLRQRAFVQEDRGVARTILVSGRKSEAVASPDVELHVFVGRFVEPAISAPAVAGGSASEPSR